MSGLPLHDDASDLEWNEPGRPAAEVRPRHLLYLAFYFPPLGGGGVQRTLKFAKYLPEFGFEPIVVTGPAQRRTRHAPLDTSLDARRAWMPRIVRVAEALPEDRRPERLRRLLGRPSRFGEAWRAACEKAGAQAAQGQPIDAILATMSPFETGEAAAALASRLRVPWVADLRDPWALDEMSVYPSRWHRDAELRRMRRCLASASLVIMNTPEAVRAVCAEFPELAARTVAITNGFDAEDFAGPPPPREGDRFRIVHTGSLHVALGTAHRRRGWLRRLAGGERIPVDIATRSHLYLIRALERWQREHPDEVGRVELILAGDLSADDRRVVEESGVSALVQMPGYLSHIEAVALLRSADLLFLPMHALPPGERSRIVPGKTYEYLGARRPILAAVPEGDARDFLLESGLSDLCAPSDVAAMAETLHRRFQVSRAGSPVTPAPDSFYTRFERRDLTRTLASALAGVIGDRAARSAQTR